MKVYVVLAGFEKDEHYEFPEGVILPCAFNTKQMIEPTESKTLFVIMKMYRCFNETHVEPLVILPTVVFAQDYISSLNIQLGKAKKMPNGKPYWMTDMLKEAITWEHGRASPTLEFETEFYIHETKVLP